MADIFVSYSRHDVQRARVVEAALKRLGYSVFFDLDGLDSSDVFPDLLDNELKAAKAVVGLWTDGALKSKWVKLECREAKGRGILVPAHIGPVSEGAKPFDLKDIDYADLTDFHGDEAHAGWQRFVASLRRAIERSGAVPPAAPAATAAKRKPNLVWIAAAGTAVAAVAIALLAWQPWRASGAAPVEPPPIEPTPVVVAPDTVVEPPPVTPPKVNAPMTPPDSSDPTGDGQVAAPSAPVSLAELKLNEQGLPEAAIKAVAMAKNNREEALRVEAKAKNVKIQADKVPKMVLERVAGTQETKDGAWVYQTGYVDGARNGYGVGRVPSGDWAGDTYWGQWKDGAKVGPGIYQHAKNPGNTSGTKAMYAEFTDAGAQGSGVIEFDNARYEGAIGEGTVGFDIKEGKAPCGACMHGFGVFRDTKAKTLYVGEYANGLKHGYGGLWSLDGKTLLKAGKWEFGKAPG